MNISLTLNDSICEKLETTATERGITLKELIRWVLGDYIRYSQVSKQISLPVPIRRNPAEQETTKLIKVSEFLIKSIIKSGALKCSNCTLALTTAAFDNGKCSSCGAEL